MTYQQGGLIEANDYNTIVNSNAGVSFNKVWSVGQGTIGYGQSSILGNVSIDADIQATEWAGLRSQANTLRTHQTGSGFGSSYRTPAVGNTVFYEGGLGFPTIPGYDIIGLSQGTGNAANQSSTTTLTTNYSSNWQNAVTYTFEATYANGDAARYFFNAGGQIMFNFEHPTLTTGVNGAMATLAIRTGNVYLSQKEGIPSPRQIGNNLFNGTTKLNGSGPAPTIIDRGYFNLQTSNVEILRQTLGSDPANGPYNFSYISVTAKTNGVQGLNGDNGNVLTFYVSWVLVPSGTLVTGGTKANINVIYPSTDNISNTWGSVSLVGFSIGS